MQSVSVMFFSQGLSKLGSSPTRMGEILGCGIPVVANEGVGDVTRIVRDYNVGVFAEGSSASEMGAAFDALGVLMRDPALPARCRAAADEVFSLTRGTEKYRELYRQVLQTVISPAAHG